jgi:malonate transporter
MEVVLHIVLPVFGLMGIGYAVAWLRMLPDRTDAVLGNVVFTVGIPLLLFRAAIAADLDHGLPWLLWAGYFPPLAAIWAAGTLVMRRLFGRDARAGVVGGVAASYGNTLFIGLPLVVIAYGTEGGAAMAMLLAVHLIVMMAASTVLIERALVADKAADDFSGSGGMLRNLVRNVLLGPVFIGIVAGVLWNLSGLDLPVPVARTVDWIANAAAVSALFAMGMSLRRFGVRGNVLPALTIGALKLVAMPLLVLATTRWVFPLPPVWAKAMVIAAACPTGVNTYLIATRFRTGEALSSNAITLSTALAIATVTIWLHVLESF